MVSKVLVANRAEIARRIFRTCRDLGYSTVAIHSEPDSGEPHVLEADEAVLLPGSTAADTYLNIEAILSAAKETGADTIHPGYGFLAENPDFARAVIDSGLTWVGPSPRAIRIMGSKLESKRLMEQIGVPTLPSVELDGISTMGSAAVSIGFPILVKASAGGGGKGMRIVDDPADLDEAVAAAGREAASAFGDDTVFLEKYLPAPRHIEIQVFGDGHGKVISLHERECSIQRRHQKIIEESPSMALDQRTRAAMGEAAVKAAQAVGYVGAGTVEFLFQDDSFFFLEMNTRLQVEHPVTEMVTGLDLVRLQFEIAQGMSLPDRGPRIRGHAVEARLYAEDPLNDYLPVTGVFHRFRFPRLDGLRLDSGIEDGSTVTVHYDPMIAKVISHAPTREGAINLLASSLRQAQIHGSTTNRALLVRILEHPEFVGTETDTHFLLRNDVAVLGRPLLDEPEERLAAVAVALTDQCLEREESVVLSTIPSGWRNSPSQLQTRSYEGSHGAHRISYSANDTFELEGVGFVDPGLVTPTKVELALGDETRRYHVSRYGDSRYVDSRIGPARLTALPRFPTKDAEDDAASLHAPMPGRVVRVDVQVGEHVDERDVLVVMEAMKMEHTLRAPHAGTVSTVLCSPGEQVDADALLVVVEEGGPS
jgi:propionyl-CoA carboxylase alpha chain